ncbi:pirin family protein [Streptacidiphilus monticola]|uniref:Pirin family protein n=1 Tax=Streptacidiphilus monticola TaxID=2161674 RepID=A0ABW1FZZ5_9ACTN
MITVHRAQDRYASTPEPGVSTRHAFSFSGHYDPENTSFGGLLACNEESLAAGSGFAPHRHRDTEILTWVLEGALSHRDDHGHAAVVRPGTLQYLSAGSGVEHSERAAEGPVRFLQFWLQPDAFGTRPRYALRTVDPAAAAVDLTQGQLRRGDASLHLRRAEPYALVDLPTATYLYLHVVRGALGFRTASGPRGVGVELAPGDAARAHATRPVDPTAGPDGVELLVWAMETPLQYG